MAQMERDAEVLNRALKEGTLSKDGRKALEEHQENLKQCHATLALIPARLPIETTFVKALEALGMNTEAEGDDQYTNLRINRRDNADGTPKSPNGYSLKPGQVVSKLSQNKSAPNGANLPGISSHHLGPTPTCTTLC
jgi:hypothetical protein